MKILIYGVGWIGQQVLRYLDEKKIPYQIGMQRAETQKELEEEIKSSDATHVMSFIGRTHGTIGDCQYTTIDYLEQPGRLRENVRDNLYSPLTLAILTQKYRRHFTYLGTGCIFEYDSMHPYADETTGFTVDDVPNFFGSSYSVVKGYTDRLMHLFDHVMNVRIRMPITADRNPRNFITKITSYKKICSVPNSMTVLPELIPVMVDMTLLGRTGTVNLTNPGLISHNEILQMYREIVDPNFIWVNFTVEEQNAILAAGRSNNCLESSILPTHGVRGIKDAVRDCLEQMKQI
jgi:hypothetical protein